MAVKRCPYCKAIIDEGAEYCTNCGTKLLFPEDEAIQEEIPGEMLKHEDFPDDEEDEEKEEEADKKKRVSEAQEEEQVAEKEEDKAEEDSPPSPPKKTRPKRKRSASKTRKVAPPVVTEKEEPVEAVEGPTEKDQPVDTGEVQDDVIVDEAAEDIEPEPEDAEEVIDVQDEVRMDTRRGKTEDLPDGFAETIEEAKAKVEDEIVEEASQEIVEKEAHDEIDEAEVAVDEEIPMDEAGKVYDQTEMEMQSQPDVKSSGVEEESPKVPLREPSSSDAGAIQTNDIEEIVDEAEKEKKEIDEFIVSVKKERENGLKIDDSGELPPWAEAMEGTTPPPMPPTDEIELQEEDVSGEVEEAVEDIEKWEAENVPQPEDEPETPVDPGPGYDTSSAFPETVAVDQKGLPFRAATKEEPLKGHAVEEVSAPDDSYQEEPYKDEPIPDEYVEEEVKEAAVQTEAPRRFKIRPRRRTTPVPFMDWIKARIFDVFFIAALWFITLWVASQVLEISVIEVISTSFSLTLIFLGILLALYFFFFLFFLGETLGNYLFSQDE
jgi:hypothetical protein